MSAMIMTAWDLGMDPAMVAAGHWVWEVEGAYFGIPIHNYAGWLATTFCIYLLYRLIAGRHRPRPWGTGGHGFESLPVLAYAVTWLSTAVVNLEIGQLGVGVPFRSQSRLPQTGIHGTISQERRTTDGRRQTEVRDGHQSAGPCADGAGRGVLS